MAVEESQPVLDGDLLLKAYVNGIFPMADPEYGVVEWFKPSLRGVLPLEAVHVSTSLARRVRSGRFKITVDRIVEYGQTTGCKACAGIIRVALRSVETPSESFWKTMG